MTSSVEKVMLLTEQLHQLLPMKNEYQQRLDKKFRLEFNYNSNHMEGNTLTYGETELLLIFDRTTGNHELREYEEMKGHDVAYELIKELAADHERSLNETAIKNLHSLLLVRPFWKEAVTPDGQYTRREIKVGNYKEYPNSVRLPNGEIFHYASPEETPIKMGELMTWLREEEEKNELHPVVLAAMLHYNFVHIHPFDDGNGRLSRLLMNYVLFRHHLPPVVIKSANKKEYLRVLSEADSGNLAPLIEYVAQQLIWSLNLSINAAKGQSISENDDLQKQIDIWRKHLKNKKAETANRDNVDINQLYANSIGQLFLLFKYQHEQFNDLFWKTQETPIINRTLFNETAYNTISGFPAFILEFEANHDKDVIHSLSLQYSLIDFKHNVGSSFSIESLINVQFEKYEYIIGYKALMLATKKYSEVITKDEMDAIVKICIQHIFEEMQEKSGVGI
ncbi:Fic family protein [Chitinophaga filiformis]|uniref:Fic family protein n=1 Tax=Chitinophaga filiformis TaxID=104663 RepID=A0ABY4I6R1_CHIFI|nr:Fic family protein [Chitinophaga filiformis]UPK71575.1 Fic family protein [Chitinophaga filiformis]